MKLQKAGVNFLVNSLTNATVALDTPAPQLSSFSLLKPSSAFPQNNNCFYLPCTSQPEWEERFGLTPVQSWILHISLERFHSRAETFLHLYSKLV